MSRKIPYNQGHKFAICMLLFSIFLQGCNNVFTYLYVGNSLQNDNTPAPTKINNNKTTIANAGKHAPPELIKEHLLHHYGGF